MNWTIISSGPSASRVTTNFLLDGPVVALNRAIGMVNEEIPVDIWACWDNPNKLLPDLLDPSTLTDVSSVWLGTTTWQAIYQEACNRMPEDRAKEVLAWQKLIPPHVGFRCMSLGFIEHGKGKRAAFGLICACEKAVDLGAKHIRILGADMSGGYISGLDEAECREEEGWDRWEYEREQVDKMIVEATKIGVVIELAHN